MSTVITENLRTAYRVFRTLYKQLGRSPSITEFAAKLECSRTNAHYVAHQLADRGYLTRIPLAHGHIFTVRTPPRGRRP